MEKEKVEVTVQFNTKIMTLISDSFVAGMQFANSGKDFSEDVIKNIVKDNMDLIAQINK